MKQLSTLFIVLLLFAASTLQAQTTPKEAEFKKIARTYTLHDDGSQTLRIQKELTIYTHTAMNRTYGETFIQYDPAWQTVKINTSYTRQKDGTIIKTPQNAFVEVLPQSAADAPAYNRLKELVVVHTGLDLGSTIYLDYTITSKPGYLPALDLLYPLKELSPIDEFSLKIDISRNKTLHYTTWNMGEQPVVSTKGKRKTVIWTLKNIQPRPYSYPYEHNAFGTVQEIASGMTPAIAATTYPSANEALKHLTSQFTEGDTKIVKSKADEIMAQAKGNATGAQQLIDAYVGLLAANPCKVSLQESGYRLRPASEVIRTAYGTAAELANLSYSLQKAAGLNAGLIVASLSPAAGTDKNAIGLSGVIATADKFASAGNTLPRIKGLQDYLRVTDAEGHPYLFKKENKEVVKRDTINAADSAYTANQLTDYQIITLKNDAAVSALYPYSGNTHITAPILLSNPLNRKLVTVVKLPEGRQWLPAKDQHIQNAAGEWTLQYTLDGNELTVSRKLLISKQLYSPTDYTDLYNLLAQWKDANNQTVVLK